MDARILYASIAIGVLVWLSPSRSSEVRLSPGIRVAEAPTQTAPSLGSAFPFKNTTITPLAEFSMSAKVLSRQDYRFGPEARLAPVDLALGWQHMSDQAVVDQIAITQSDRWYSWSAAKLPIPEREIETQSANMHLIPKDPFVESRIREARQGEIITLRGKLVEVRGNDGWSWRSSLTREDRGAGACEVIFVESFYILNRG